MLNIYLEEFSSIHPDAKVMPRSRLMRAAIPVPILAREAMSMRFYQPICAWGANAFTVRVCGKRCAFGF
ncbi:hypothetical protein, partial [Achromobacter mucicolens]|uniref:hypothetical protein n=1 Tax=Achromobacter mucicolens TaxID=1389922 RepID=UPI0028AC95DA